MTHSQQFPSGKQVPAMAFALVSIMGCIMAFSIAALLAPARASAQPQYSITPPPGWTDRHDQPDGLLRQIVEPGENAMVEIYCTRGTMDSLDEFANQAEQGIRDLGMPYVARRDSSQMFTKHGARSIGRTYTGSYNGVALAASIHYLVHDGYSLVVLGVYPRDYPEFRTPVLATLESFRVGPPPSSHGSSPINPLSGMGQSSTGQTATGASPSGQGSAQAGGGLRPPAPVSSSVADPIELLPQDTALDGVLAGRTWEVDAFPMKAEEHELLGQGPYRLAYASYLPVGQETPLVDVSVYTGSTPTLSRLLQEQLDRAEGSAGGNGAWAGTLQGRAAVWVLKEGRLFLVTAPDHALAAQLATIASEQR